MFGVWVGHNREYGVVDRQPPIGPRHSECLRLRRLCGALLRTAILVFFLLCVAVVQEAAPGDQVRLRLATTTSVENSGLLPYILPAFEHSANVKVDVVAVGTGAALTLAKNGDADAVLVHDPVAEERFVSEGFGVNRREVMRNHFVLVGPKEDPAGVRSARNASDAFRRVALKSLPFVSRGDSSGTHRKELSVWKLAGLSPSAPWYQEAGQGMGATLQMASEKQAYCLTDRGTFDSYAGKLELVVLLESAAEFLNVYSVIAVNPARFQHVHFREAMKLITWLTSPEGRLAITSYRRNGRSLFTPSDSTAVSVTGTR